MTQKDDVVSWIRIQPAPALSSDRFKIGNCTPALSMFPRTEITVSGLDLHALAPSRSMRLVKTLYLDESGLNLDDSRGFWPTTDVALDSMTTYCKFQQLLRVIA